MNYPFTIVDIETTGSGIQGNKITEISIFRVEGRRITDEFTSLVNPGCDIPYFITALTGIDGAMVRNAPSLAEIAPEIHRITEGSVFVAHSVNFDYHVIKNEFKLLGLHFSRKRLCTVRLSRKVFPGLRSYSLGKLCSSLEIPLTDRHRARGDARATVSLFNKILSCEGADSIIERFLNARSQEATLPPGLPRSVYEELPAKPGVYYFKNSRGVPIYVGKAKNIKKRVLTHFYDKADKEVQMCRETTDIDFELSGSEVMALLMESSAIKKLFPIYNRAQKRHVPQYAIFSYEDRKGVLHLAYNKIKNIPIALASFYTITECRLFLEELCLKFGLCPRYCHLQDGAGRCSHFRVPSCGGICAEAQELSQYNRQVEEAIDSIREGHGHFIIREKGRTPQENGIILVKDGLYCGYGFVDKEANLPTLEDVLAFITPQKNTPETKRLLETYRIKHPENTLIFEGVT